MDSKETFKSYEAHKTLVENEEYFKYIFKKTEKIASAVFYITRSIPNDLKKDILVVKVESDTIAVLETAKKTLSVAYQGEYAVLNNLRIDLTSLESELGVLVGARILPADLFEVFVHEISNVQRNLKGYLERQVPQTFLSFLTTEIKPEKRKREVSRGEVSTSDKSSGIVQSHLPTRRERVLSIIREKGQVTIKDIAHAISDVSEKTVQRELMTLITEGQIVKDGERRWSKYRVI